MLGLFMVATLLFTFMLMFVCTLQAASWMPFSYRASKWIIALSVAALSVLGLLTVFPPVSSTAVKGVILIPYAVLPVAMVLVLFLWLVMKRVQPRCDDPHRQRSGLFDQRNRKRVLLQPQHSMAGHSVRR